MAKRSGPATRTITVAVLLLLALCLLRSTKAYTIHKVEYVAGDPCVTRLLTNADCWPSPGVRGHVLCVIATDDSDEISRKCPESVQHPLQSQFVVPQIQKGVDIAVRLSTVSPIDTNDICSWLLDEALAPRCDVPPFSTHVLVLGPNDEATLNLLTTKYGDHIRSVLPAPPLQPLALHSFWGVSVNGASGPQTWPQCEAAVGLIDTGFDKSHTWLPSAMTLIKGMWGDYADNTGHGTHTASTLWAASGAGGPGATITGYDVMDSSGNLIVQDMYAALEQLYSAGARVISLSIGTDYGTYDDYAQAVDLFIRAHPLDAEVLVAAGNSGAGTLNTIARCRNCLAVGSTFNTADGIQYAAPYTDPYYMGLVPPGANENVVGDYSARASTQDGRSKPELVAPGCPVTAARFNTASGLLGMCGTSMSAPVAAGAFAQALHALGGGQSALAARAALVLHGVPVPQHESRYTHLDFLQPAAGGTLTVVGLGTSLHLSCTQPTDFVLSWVADAAPQDATVVECSTAPTKVYTGTSTFSGVSALVCTVQATSSLPTHFGGAWLPTAQCTFESQLPPTPTPTPTATPTAVPTPTAAPTPTAVPTPSPTPTATATATCTPDPAVPSPSDGPPPTASPTAAPTDPAPTTPPGATPTQTPVDDSALVALPSLSAAKQVGLSCLVLMVVWCVL